MENRQQEWERLVCAAREALQNTQTVELANASCYKVLRLWKYSSFAEPQSWTLLKNVHGAYAVERVLWDRTDDGERMFVAKAGLRHPSGFSETPSISRTTVLIENTELLVLLEDLVNCYFSPFCIESPSVIDGNNFGLETYGAISCRFVWSDDMPEAWLELRKWYERAILVFESAICPADDPV